MFKRITLRGKLLLASILVEIVMLGLLLGNSVRLIDQHLGAAVGEPHPGDRTGLQDGGGAAARGARLRHPARHTRWLAQAEDVRYLVVIDKQGRKLAASGWNNGDVLAATGTGCARRRCAPHVRFSVDYLGQVYGDVQYGLSTGFIQVAKRSC
jgi:hypothetical protein